MTWLRSGLDPLSWTPDWSWRRRLNTTAGTSRLLTDTHDADGNRDSLTFPDNVQFTFQYDGLDRMNGIVDNNGTTIAGG